MRVYIASKGPDIDLCRGVQAMVLAAGHEITFDWTGPDGEFRDDWSEHPERARALSTRERDAVRSANVLVLCTTEPTGGLGCWIETGMALALNIPVIVLGPARESVFWYLPQVERVPDLDAFSEWLNNSLTVHMITGWQE